MKYFMNNVLKCKKDDVALQNRIYVFTGVKVK